MQKLKRGLSPFSLTFYLYKYNQLKITVMKITIDTHYCSKEELKTLTNYLKKRCWDFKVEEKQKFKEEEFVLTDNAINGVSINEKINDEELFEYRIIDRKDFIYELIGWIAESKNSDKILMKNDLELLLEIEDDYIFSSISTNDYIYTGCSEFDDTCKELLELNNSMS